MGKILKSLGGFLIAILRKAMVLVVASVAVGFLISIIFKFRLSLVLKILGIVIMGIGVSSIMGGTRIANDARYNWSKGSSGITDITRMDYELRMSSYEFCTFMSISGLIILIIGLFVNR